MECETTAVGGCLARAFSATGSWKYLFRSRINLELSFTLTPLTIRPQITIQIYMGLNNTYKNKGRHGFVQIRTMLEQRKPQSYDKSARSSSTYAALGGVAVAIRFINDSGKGLAVLEIGDRMYTRSCEVVAWSGRRSVELIEGVCVGGELAL